MLEDERSVAWDEWIATHDETFRCRQSRSAVYFLPLCYQLDPESSFSSTLDARAIDHVFTHSDKFEKPLERNAAPELLGEGTNLAAMLSFAC